MSVRDLVSDAQQASMDAARLGIRPRLDHAVLDDGPGSLAGLATHRLVNRAGPHWVCLPCNSRLMRSGRLCSSRLHSPGIALVDIILLWAAIAATLWSFGRISALAASLFVPYLMWVSYATALNWAIWRMNP